MNKIYYLKTCDTCKRIMKTLPLDQFELQEIKSKPILKSQLSELREMTDSYENLFSKRSKKYKSMDLKNQNLTERDYEQLILDEYTFLKRPVIIFNNKLFVGSDKKNLKALSDYLEK